MHQFTKRRKLQSEMSHSTTKELILDSLKDRSDIALRGCFSFFKTNVITANDITEIALQASCINQLEYHSVMNSPESDLQIEMVIKFIIRKGKYESFEFIKHLYHSNFIAVVQYLQRHTGEYNDDIGEDRILTPKLLHEETAYLRSNIKVNQILDKLFERGVLTIEDHDDIQKHDSRPAKRKALLSIILKKRGNTWFPVFIRCLQLTGHEGMLHELRCRQRGQPKGTQPWNDPPFQYLAHIANVNDPPSESTFDTDNNVEALTTFSQCVNAGLIDVWIGSLYMLLNTTNPAKLNAIIVTQDYEQLKDLLEELFNNNQNLIEKFGLNKTLKFELEERHGLDMLDQRHGKKSTLDRKHFTEDCLECYLATLRGNYTEVLDEIEEDIINDVLSSCKDVSAYAKRQCLDSRKTRVESAIFFLQLALANDSVLSKLRESLAHFSAVKFIKFKCQTCKDGGCDTGKGLTMSTKRVSFMFQLKQIQNMSTVYVHMLNGDSHDSDASLLPGPSQRVSLIRSYSTLNNVTTEIKQDLSDRERIVIVVNEGRHHGNELNIIERHYTTYTLPISTSYGIDNKSRTKLGECIAYTSPGPHVFLVMCDLEECKNLQRKIHHLVGVFGEAVKRYILVACIINDKTKQDATILVQQNPFFKVLEPGLLLIDKTSIQEKLILDMIQPKIKELRNRQQPEYFTNSCFKVSESRIQENMEAMQSRNDLKVRCLQERIEILKHKDWRVEATRETANSLTCRTMKETNAKN